MGKPPVKEQWRPVPGYERQYEVSDMGNVRSLDRGFVDSKGRECARKGQMLLASPGPTGYRTVSIGGYDAKTVGTLVLMAFVGTRPDGAVARHRNHVKTDDRLTNLSWGSPPGTMGKAYKS